MNPRTGPLRVGLVPEHFTLPWRLAAERGELSGVEIVDQLGGTGQMRDGLADDQLDMALMLTEGAIAAIHGGLPAHLRYIYQTTPLIWGVHAAAQRATPIAHRDGARFAVSRLGSGSHLMAFLLARRAGWHLDDSSFVVVDNIDGARAALAADTADLFLWDRYMTDPLVQAGEFALIDEQPTPWPSLVVTVGANPWTERSNEIEQVLAVVDRSARRFTTNFESINTVTNRYGLSRSTARDWFWRTGLSCHQPVTLDLVDSVSATLVDVGVLPRGR